MKRKLTKSQQAVWDRLNYVPPSKDYYSFANHVPHNPVVGSVYMDTNANQMLYYDGTAWMVMK